MLALTMLMQGGGSKIWESLLMQYLNTPLYYLPVNGNFGQLYTGQLAISESSPLQDLVPTSLVRSLNLLLTPPTPQLMLHKLHPLHSPHWHSLLEGPGKIRQSGRLISV